VSSQAVKFLQSISGKRFSKALAVSKGDENTDSSFVQRVHEKSEDYPFIADVLKSYGHTCDAYVAHVARMRKAKLHRTDDTFTRLSIERATLIGLLMALSVLIELAEKDDASTDPSGN